jgi:hypothetical protein
MVTRMDGVSAPASPEALAVAVQAKSNKQSVQEAKYAAQLIEAAMPKPLPPDATFSTYA